MTAVGARHTPGSATGSPDSTTSAAGCPTSIRPVRPRTPGRARRRLSCRPQRAEPAEPRVGETIQLARIDPGPGAGVAEIGPVAQHHAGPVQGGRIGRGGAPEAGREEGLQRRHDADAAAAIASIDVFGQQLRRCVGQFVDPGPDRALDHFGPQRMGDDGQARLVGGRDDRLQDGRLEYRPADLAGFEGDLDDIGAVSSQLLHQLAGPGPAIEANAA